MQSQTLASASNVLKSCHASVIVAAHNRAAMCYRSVDAGDLSGMKQEEVWASILDEAPSTVVVAVEISLRMMGRCLVDVLVGRSMRHMLAAAAGHEQLLGAVRKAKAAVMEYDVGACAAQVFSLLIS